MPFAGPRKHFVSLLRSSASQVHDARCWMASNSRLWEKACGLALGEGREQNLCICLFNLEIRHLRGGAIFCVLIVVPLS